MKGRNPKAETRRPKTGGQGGCGPCTCRMAFLFGLRISALLRPSDFGLRVLPLVLPLLSSALSLPAASPASPDDIPPLRPPHAEMPPTFWEQHGLWVVICGGLLLALVCAAARLLTRPRPPAVVPPEVRARQTLEPLRQQPEDGALLSRVSQILRHYAAAAFDLPPGELTTAEFCRAIDSHAQLGPDLSAALSEFLCQCDQRKFSPPAPAAPLGAVAQALKLIDQAQARRSALTQPAAPGCRTSECSK